MSDAHRALGHAQGSRLRWRDADVLVALAALWVLSFVRVAGAAVRHEVFGAEATLAFISLILVPWVVFRARPGARPASRATHAVRSRHPERLRVVRGERRQLS